eukprot:jgi/Botrbrau1/8585/Bobra.0380s0007.1
MALPMQHFGAPMALPMQHFGAPMALPKSYWVGVSMGPPKRKGLGMAMGYPSRSQKFLVWDVFGGCETLYFGGPHVIPTIIRIWELFGGSQTLSNLEHLLGRPCGPPKGFQNIARDTPKISKTLQTCDTRLPKTYSQRSQRPYTPEPVFPNHSQNLPNLDQRTPKTVLWVRFGAPVGYHLSISDITAVRFPSLSCITPEPQDCVRDWYKHRFNTLKTAAAVSCTCVTSMAMVTTSTVVIQSWQSK